ncbi:MAG: helix-turn-helix transcriptional regulator [Proteobacteria bacterium]|nr:helix-turn-helix transcriptional regulator [Pseudomonadota bacterium]
MLRLREAPGVSAPMIAEETGEMLATARYHLLVLEDEGLVEVAEVLDDPETGGILQIFRATPSAPTFH